VKKRAYKSGSKWALWRWTETPSGYITRLHLLMTPWFAICLHWISTPDKEPWLHDHPVSFLSFILRGWYVEVREHDLPFARSREIKVRRWFNSFRASFYDRHRIILTQKRTLTLCFMGPKVRTWGFHTDEGWIDWKTYNDETYTDIKKTNDFYRKYYSEESLEKLANMPSLSLAKLTRLSDEIPDEPKT
jgi:hypothetical protein